MTIILKIIIVILIGGSALFGMGSILSLELAEIFESYLERHDNKGNRFMAFFIENENVFFLTGAFSCVAGLVGVFALRWLVVG